MFEGPAWTAARNRIVMENLQWAYAIADKVLKQLPTWFAKEDMHAHVELALIRKADEYKGYQCVPFRAFAVRRITGACYDAIRRKEYTERAHDSLDAQSEEGMQIQVADPGDSPERSAELEEMKGVWLHVHQLPARHAQIIRWIYGEQKTNKEAAQALGLSEGWVSGLHSEALAMLRKMMEAK